MEFAIKNTEVYGLNKTFIASGNPMRTEMADNTKEPTEKDIKRLVNLSNTKIGEGHDNALNGIIVQFDLYAPLYMWKQLQRYHFLDFISSCSTMHCLSKFNVAEHCTKDVDKEILNRYQYLLGKYNNSVEKSKEQWRTLVASLPSGFVLGATMTTNYRQLKTIYFQRKNHRLSEWHEFCSWCETLPMFKELVLGIGINDGK